MKKLFAVLVVIGIFCSGTVFTQASTQISDPVYVKPEIYSFEINPNPARNGAHAFLSYRVWPVNDPNLVLDFYLNGQGILHSDLATFLYTSPSWGVDIITLKARNLMGSVSATVKFVRNEK